MKKSKHILKRALSFVLVFITLVTVSLVGLVSAAESTNVMTGIEAYSDDTRTVYFSPNGNWSNLFAVYAWTDGSYDSGEWKALEKVEGADGLWSVELSLKYTNAIFCSRTIPAFSWSAVDHKTDALVISDEYNYLALAGDTTAMWGHYNTGDNIGDVTDTQKVYFTPNAEWTDIQSTLYHSFAVHAYNDISAEGVWLELALVEGEIGQYPTVWMAEIPTSYDIVEFCRIETVVDGGWYVWEQTEDQTIPADSNRFTQYDDVKDGTWSYYAGAEVTPDDPEEPTPDVPTEPTETVSVYFTPNQEWIAYVQTGDGNIAVASCNDGEELVWNFAYKVADGVYCADIPADDTTVVFGVSFGDTADLVWVQTNSQDIPVNSNHFIQDEGNSLIGTWGTYGDTAVGVYYSVAFVNWDNTLLSAQSVIEGGSAVAPTDPVRERDSQYTYTFKGWDKSFDNVMADIIVTAQYDKTAVPAVTPVSTGTLKIEVSGGTGFKISVDGAAARPQGATYLNSKAPIGVTVTVTANTVSGATFIGWANPITGVVLSTDMAYTFKTTGNDFIKAMYSVSVEGVQMVTFKNDKANRILESQYYASSDTIAFPEDPTQIGFDFAGWNMTEEEIQAAIARGEDVTVVANWTRQIVLVNVTVNGGTGTGKYNANSAVKITANTAPEGKKFAYWTDTAGNIKSYNTEYEFYPTSDVELSAVYVAYDAVIDYQILVNVDTIDTVSVEGKNVFYYSWYVPAEYEFVTAGIVAVNKDNYNEASFYAGSQDSNVYTRYPNVDSNTTANTYTWTKSNVAAGQTWMAKAFVQYKDASGNTMTVYSDIVEAIKD